MFVDVVVKNSDADVKSLSAYLFIAWVCVGWVPVLLFKLLG
ncbi:hypothetical protein [Edwardsiella phage MSW-3]|uniref:Uncharacterized protein n=1 Tax=Edwardsiella phage MSW-3 TaxID=1264700 RepID=L0MX78_9CAUD|nr:hypothetical protein G428_gp08 [Edwardsiella phage MSW-3]BAM68829.1 hypothetical protein [Edwardsiella phage MSW-3]